MTELQLFDVFSSFSYLSYFRCHHLDEEVELVALLCVTQCYFFMYVCFVCVHVSLSNEESIMSVRVG